MTEQPCPIWGTPAIINESRDFFYEVSSSRAGGLYKISRGVNDDAMWQTWSNLQKALLTTWLIDQRRQAVIWPEITAELIDKSWRQSRQRLPVQERADRLLKYISEKTSIIGSPVQGKLSDQCDVAMEMMAWSESLLFKELIYLGAYLAEQGWVNKFRNDSGHIMTTITVKGYAHLAELATKQINSSQGFVAMWFPDTKNKDYDLIKKAYDQGIYAGIDQAGYKPYRVDRDEHNDQITDKIISEIRRSKFLVSDFTHGDTGVRGGVYYEAGFAHGLNIPVIFTCFKERFSPEIIHFDISHQNFILWETPEDLREKLKNRITGSEIGWGPGKLSKA